MKEHIDLEELKKHFCEYILIPVLELTYSRQIYKDFKKAYRSKGLYADSFTDFVTTNYYKTTITELCKLLEPGKREDDINFNKFITNIKDHKGAIEKYRMECFTRITRMRNIPSYITLTLDDAEHKKNLEELQNHLKKFKTYRNKVVCHRTSLQIDPPTEENIDNTILFLEKLMKTYANLLGFHVIDSKPIYFNPPLNDRAKGLGNPSTNIPQEE